MVRIHSLTTMAIPDGMRIAVLLKPVTEEQRHIALFHRSDAAGGRALHLAWHLDLRDDRADNWTLWIDLSLPEERSRILAAICRKVETSNRRNSITYALSKPTGCFDAETLEFLVGPTMHGLTCATFVIAVLGIGGVAILDWEAWEPRPDDERWQRQILEQLRRTKGVSAEHLAAVESEIGSWRIRPVEVGAGAALSPPVASFVAAVKLGSKIEDVLGENAESGDLPRGERSN